MAREEDMRRDPNWHHYEDRPAIFPAENKTAPPLAQSNTGSGGNIAGVTIQNDVTIDLAALRLLIDQAEEARADLDNDFPVGAVARGKWQAARRAMADAAPGLLAHIALITSERDAAQQAISDYAIRTSMKVEGVSREENDRACFQALMKHGRDRSQAMAQRAVVPSKAHDD